MNAESRLIRSTLMLQAKTEHNERIAAAMCSFFPHLFIIKTIKAPQLKLKINIRGNQKSTLEVGSAAKYWF